MWEGLNRAVTWIGLGRVKDSFLGKAVTAISLAALVLGNVGKVLTDVGLDPLSAKLTFIGGAAFIVGYLSFSLFVPSEFRRSGEVDEIVGRLKELSDFEFFKSRRNLAAALMTKIGLGTSFGLPEGDRLFLQNRVADALGATLKTWEAKSSSLYHADINLRQYARPIARMWVALAFGTGIVLLAGPTLMNIFKMMGA